MRKIWLLLFLISVVLQAQNLDPKSGKIDNSGTTLWYDARLLTLEGQGWSQTKAHYDRLPASAEEWVPEAVWNLGQHSAGLSLGFTTNAEQIKVRWPVWMCCP